MLPRLVLLSGEHPTLPAAELRALLDVHDPGATATVAGPIATVVPADAAGTDAALARMALAHAWGEAWGTASASEAGLEELAKAVALHAPGGEPAAVSSER
ncbi:MAG TPA: hypothetical protein VHI93_01785, partial [Candidatus Thermoplasmatota archaeon]|nr:hypothetical protein [Candidatus Thermoplasmatota archaeon]